MQLVKHDDHVLKCQVFEDRMPVPYQSPWRTITAVKKPGELITSKILVNLNDPPEGDFSWVKPGKSLWDWRVRDGKHLMDAAESYEQYPEMF